MRECNEIETVETGEENTGEKHNKKEELEEIGNRHGLLHPPLLRTKKWSSTTEQREKTNGYRAGSGRLVM